MIAIDAESERADPVTRQARRLVALGEFLPSTVEPPNEAAPRLLDELIFAVLAYRTSPANARSAYARLRSRYPDCMRLVEAPLAEVAETVRAAGLAHQRAGLIRRLVEGVQASYPDGSLEALRGEDDPTVLAALTSLPGVGQFAALHVMLYALDRPVLPVAWRMIRLLGRLGIVNPQAPVDQVLLAAAALLPPGRHRALYESLLAHALTVCTSRMPRCQRCCLTGSCAYYQRRPRFRFPASPVGGPAHRVKPFRAARS